MKGSSIAFSVLGTIAIAGYMVATEWRFWEKWTDKSSAQPKHKLVKRAKKPKKAKTKKGYSSSVARTEPTTEPTEAPATQPRKGSGFYWIDDICDCQASNKFLLETVEITPDSTILTILNARRELISAYPPGHESAQYLLEWTYDENGNRRRHELKELRGIPEYPDSAAPLTFQLVFPRITDNAKKFQLTGKATRKLDYFMFTSIDLDNEMTREQKQRHDAYRRCGFDGATRIPADAEKSFNAYKHPGSRGFQWTASSGVSIVGSARKNAVKVRADDPGTGEVCLKAQVDGDSCRYCQEVEVTSAARVPQPDFAMKSCGGLPSQEPHWQFEVTRPAPGASYTWGVSDAKIMRGSKTKRTLIMRPNLVPGKFQITLHAKYKSGETSSYSREFHNIYSCLDPS